MVDECAPSAEIHEHAGTLTVEFGVWSQLERSGRNQWWEPDAFGKRMS